MHIKHVKMVNIYVRTRNLGFYIVCYRYLETQIVFPLLHPYYYKYIVSEMAAIWKNALLTLYYETASYNAYTC